MNGREESGVVFVFCILDRYTVEGIIPFIGRILLLAWFGVPKFVSRGKDIASHGNFDPSFVVIPVDCETTI